MFTLLFEYRGYIISEWRICVRSLRKPLHILNYDRMRQFKIKHISFKLFPFSVRFVAKAPWKLVITHPSITNRNIIFLEQLE